MRILLVEDDESLIQALTKVLAEQNYLVDIATDGEMGWEMIHAIPYDLALLDVVLPTLDGISLCRRLREHNHQIPVMLLTARDSTTDKLMGLDSGADDYMIKPFHIQELLARIRALSRRLREQSTSSLCCGLLCLDPATRQITYDGQPLHFSRKEYLLLELFLRYPQRVFSRGDIVDHLWSFEDPPNEDTVKSHIKRIRRKLSKVGAGELIETLYGHGYRVNAEFFTSVPPASASAINLSPLLDTAIEQIWQTIRDGVFERIAILEQTIGASNLGNLEEEQRQQAEYSAHQLAGTLGTFGFDGASHLAKAIETLLQNQPTLKKTSTLPSLVAALKLELEEVHTTEPALETCDFSSSDASDSIDSRGHHILAIDDDPHILVLLERLLVPQGLAVTTLQTPAAIWDTLESVQPNLLILDINMPEVSGLELCQAVREHPQWNWLPILFLTVQTDRQTVKQVFACGADDYVAKPIIPDELSIRIFNRIRRSQLLRNQVG